MVFIAAFPFIALWTCVNQQAMALKSDGQAARMSFWWTVCVVLFCAASMTDLATTLAFFHRKTIELEVHPGIRLVSYAYGRTMGPILAKSFQAVSLWWLTRSIPRWMGMTLLVAASLLAVAATVHNTGA